MIDNFNGQVVVGACHAEELGSVVYVFGSIDVADEARRFV
jgi:hypothetical protein|tara:strand:- start:93 stop:212 length:120 start_codon:yes stop_codon:yes gene_type:complete